LQTSPRTLVIGLGNPILGDDSVGIHVARAVRSAVGARADVEVVEETHGGLKLMEQMIGYDRVIVVDAITSGDPAGTVARLRLDGRPSHRSASAHDVDLPTALAVGRQTGAHLPRDEDILLIGIAAEEVETFGDEMTPAVEAAVPRAAARVLAALDEMREAT
jgi:hydrogenase maturation protease